MMPVPDKDARRQFGELLQRARVHMELTHHDLADWCGVNQAVYKSWEAGDEVPKGREWARIKGRLRSLRAAGPVWQAALAVGREQTTIAAESLAAEAADNERREEEWFEHQPLRLTEEPDEPAAPVEVPPLQDPRAQTSFGSALRIARLNIGFTQDELGQLLEVGGSTISQWECEGTTPVLENWVRLTDALPELRDCTPPGVRNIRAQTGPRYPRAATNPGTVITSALVPAALAPSVVIAGVDVPSNLTHHGAPPLGTKIVMPPVPSSTPATMTDEIAQAGVAYAKALVDQRKAQLAVEQAKTNLNVTQRALGGADDRIKLAQATLVRLVEKLNPPAGS
jgi:DNA-binding XRE family transcriptional regulator